MNNQIFEYKTICKHIAKAVQAQAQPKALSKSLQCQRSERKCLKNLPTLTKIKNAVKLADRDRQEAKMKMIEKLNKDNDLQDWKTEHQAVTGGIFYCRDSAGFSVSASNKLSYNLTG